MHEDVHEGRACGPPFEGSPERRGATRELKDPGFLLMVTYES
ncbi:MAG TPA: hypothetical protein RMH99_20770 [Sandaracinaceae bacterium LLY-WYZ-13_1]|nr:hypothetical protein [Sandaracinaceae bacterium LLY-WYZ-13_1]